MKDKNFIDYSKFTLDDYIVAINLILKNINYDSCYYCPARSVSISCKHKVDTVLCYFHLKKFFLCQAHRINTGKSSLSLFSNKPKLFFNLLGGK